MKKRGKQYIMKKNNLIVIRNRMMEMNKIHTVMNQMIMVVKRKKRKMKKRKKRKK